MVDSGQSRIPIAENPIFKQQQCAVQHQQVKRKEDFKEEPAGATYPKIDPAELYEHDSAEKAWVALDGTVYDVTKWHKVHPGGSKILLAECGTDATRMFRDVHTHSKNAIANAIASNKVSIIGTVDTADDTLQHVTG